MRLFYTPLKTYARLLTACMLFSFFAVTVHSQVTVTSSGGIVVPTGYANLSSAFTALNAGTHTGTITIDISASYTDVATAVLNSSGAGAASYTSVNIRPSNDGVTVSFASVSGRGVIELNGADNVTIDGDNPGTGGTNRNLTITNTALNTTTYTSVIRVALSTLITSGNSNTVKNCIINGSATGRNLTGITSTTGSEHTTYGILVGGSASTVAVTTAPSAITSVSTTIGSGITATSFTADNNRIDACARGIAVNGSATTVANLLSVTNNVIGSSTAGNTTTVYSRGMSLQGFDNTTISGNTIQNMAWFVGTAEMGIGLGEVSASGTNATVSKNTISGINNQSTSTFGVYGISAGAGANITIYNNSITNLTGDMTGGAAFSTTFGIIGIRLAASTGHKVYYNSVNIYGARAGTPNSSLLSAAFAITATTVTGCDVRNNIFSNTQSGGTTSLAYVSIFLPSSGTSAMNLTLNNNLYYCGSTAGSQGVCHAGTTYTAIPAGPATYAGLYTAANFNAASTAPTTNLRAYTSILSVAGTNDNASFASTTAAPYLSTSNLHINTGAANYTDVDGKAVVIALVPTDYDGETRNASTPDIGMDEFSAGACAGVPAGGTIAPSTASTCAGLTYNMSATGAGTGTGITYQWEISATGGGAGFGDVVGGTGAGTTSYTTAALIAGTYYYRLKTKCATGPDSSYSNELTLTVNPSPTAGTAAGPTSGVTYTNYNYTLTGYTGGATLQWQSAAAIGGPYVDIPGATADNVTLFSGAGGTFYVRCSVTSGGCPSYSNIITVVITVAGDDVCNAVTLSTGLNGPYTNVGATTQVGEAQAPNTSCTGQLSWCTGTSGLVSNSVWFTFTAPASGRVSIHYSPGNWDSQLALWSAPNCAALTSGGGTLLAANDDSTGLTPFNAYIAAICVTPGQTYWVQMDGYGTTTNAAFNIQLLAEPNAAPAILGCPSNIVVNANAGACTHNVSWTAPTANDPDNCVAPLSFTSTHSPGASFPIGTTLVTYTAYDGVNTTLCSFNVTVNTNPADIWYADSDGDSYGDPSVSTLSCSAPMGYVTDNTDCDDTDEDVNPAATEICNGIDDDCNALSDDADPGVTGTSTWYADDDEDTYGDASTSTTACVAPMGYVSDDTDCNDLDGSIHPGATDICNGGIDDDCDGISDEDAVFTTYYLDTDGDTYGDPLMAGSTCSGPPPGYVSDNTDCDDSDEDINPGATEICNAIDDDCDGTADDGLTFDTWYADSDGDTYGDASMSTVACAAPMGYVLDDTDCDDADEDINPGATEICNAIDDDCDGDADDGLTYDTWYADSDGDTYGDASMSTSTCDGAPEGYVADDTDCDDADGSINPGATEICNAIDDDCDGDADDGLTFTTWYADTDGDTYGDAFNTTSTCDGAPEGYVGDDTDCDDTQSTVYPGGEEICDGLDNDCDGEFDEGTVTATVTPSPTATLCKGDILTFVANNGGGYTYQWFKNGNIIVGATNSTYNATKAGNYQVQVNSPEGCFAISSATLLTVTPKPNATINAPNGTSLCTTVKLKVTQNAAYTYQWYKDGFPIGGATNFLYVATLPGDYYCTVTATASGCFRNSATLTVTACKEGEETVEAGMLQLYPNPTDHAFTINLVLSEVNATEADIRIFNLVGDLVYSTNGSLINHTLVKNIELDNTIPGGVYLVKVTAGNADYTQQLILQK